MNEAFSDITGMAINNYMRTNLGYAWYWDGLDWTTGSTINKQGRPMRWLNTPTRDGVSIDNAINYRTGMNTHFSSGVYNKAFYLLSTKPGWNIQKAYEIILDANRFYWTPGSTFANGACGVITATTRRGYSVADVRNVFSQVGVNCPFKDSKLSS
jgi:pseudolysin